MKLDDHETLSLEWLDDLAAGLRAHAEELRQVRQLTAHTTPINTAQLANDVMRIQEEQDYDSFATIIEGWRAKFTEERTA